MNTKTREVWPDNVKTFACILVVLGHFLQSMTKAEILSPDGWHIWFDRAVYLFHVQLFFVCSGYLYQKYTIIDSAGAWGKNVLKKLFLLGVPYFFFSSVSWVLKYVFVASVNSSKVGLLHVLFVEPMAPFWYLYTLFLIFVIIPSVKTKKGYLFVLLVAIVLKCFYIFEIDFPFFALESLCSNTIWFVLGMGMVFVDFKKWISERKVLWVGGTLFGCFLIGSVYVYRKWMWNRTLDTVLGIVACTAVLLIIGYVFQKNFQMKVLEVLSRYTMPIFLMHTIFAAGIRILLFRIGIELPLAHFVLGIAISFIGPILTAGVLERIPYGDFVIYPGKYLKRK